MSQGAASEGGGLGSAPWSRGRPRHADRRLVVISDTEIGAGGMLDDLPQSAFVADLLLDLDQGPDADLAIDVVFNGDTFDLMKTAYEDTWPRHVTADIAMAKMSRIAAAHPRLFAGLRRFLASGRGRRRFFFVVGNHDFELLFPEVQALLRSLLGADEERVVFPGMSVRLGEVHIEHGCQADSMFCIRADKPFVEHAGETILNLPWGSVALLDVAMPLQPVLAFHDRLKPRDRLFQALPELEEVFVSRFWRYWTRDYLRGWLSRSDPVKRVSWKMFRELAWRFGSKSIQTRVDDTYVKLLDKDGGPRVACIGHLHDAAWTAWGGCKLLKGGAMRNEFLFSRDGSTLTMLPKVYIELWMAGDTVLRSQLVEIDGPPPPAGYVPDSVFDVRPTLRELLGTKEEREEVAAALVQELERDPGTEEVPTEEARSVG